jgi:hypothetical protein
MRSNEPTLRALHAQAQFEIVAAGAAVAHAVAHSSSAERETNYWVRRCDVTARQLRRTVKRPRANPVLLDTLGRLYRGATRELYVSEATLVAAQQHEQSARDRLAEIRCRERAIGRALRVERHKESLRQQTFEGALQDDLWLLNAWRVRI